jgi:hypothetical protein
MAPPAATGTDRSTAWEVAFDPRCPRCGYDQTGALAAMRDACPLESRCVECGLELRWGELASGRLSAPRWLVEHAPRSRAAIALLTTFVVAPIGIVLWRALRLENPTIAARLLALLVAAVMTVLLIVASPGVLEANRMLDRNVAGLPIGTPSPGLGVRASLAGRIVGMPLSDRPLTVALLGPTGAPTTFTLAPPRRLLFGAFSPVLAAAWWLSFVTAVGSLIAFVAMPATRRQAKVEARHFARCVVYLFATLPFVALAILLLEPRTLWWGGRTTPSALAVFEDPRVLGAWIVWLFPWWWTACRFYLRLARPALAAGAATAIGILVAGAAAVVASA